MEKLAVEKTLAGKAEAGIVPKKETDEEKTKREADALLKQAGMA
jgi:hypothetical protein